MENKKFAKNDCGFVCENCGKNVAPLNYTSRDHCPFCLVSKHVDINPGDRANACQGMLVPISLELNSKKGKVIVFKCQKCGELHKNICAEDDDFETLLKLSNYTYNVLDYKK